LPMLLARAWSMAYSMLGGFLYGSKSPATDMLEGRGVKVTWGS
jgi:hypothetical protein